MIRKLSWLVLFVLVMLSLALNVVILGALWQVRSVAKDEITAFADDLALSEKQTLTVTVRLKQAVPIQASVPIKKDINVPINTTVAINQTIRVPVNSPLGTINLDVPLKTDVPINLTVPVAINETVLISTTVNLDLTLPVSIPMAETPLPELFKNLRQRLLEFVKQF